MASSTVIPNTARKLTPPAARAGDGRTARRRDRSPASVTGRSARRRSADRGRCRRDPRQVDEDEERREHRHDGLHERVVAAEDRVHRQPADPGPGEDRLGDDRAPEQDAELEADDGDERNGRVLQRVLVGHHEGADPGGAGGPHVVLGQHLQHSRARQARDPRHGEGAEGAGGEHERAEPVAAGGGKPAEPHREDEDEQEPEPVDRHGLAQQHADRADRVEERVAAERGQDADGHRHEQGEREARDGQLERRGQRAQDETEGGHLMLEREPEIAPHRAGQEPHVLQPQRVVEPEQGAELPDVLLARLERQEQPRRIAGQMQEPEHDHGDPQQDEHALQEPPREEGEHQRSRPPPGGERGRRPRPLSPEA